MYILTHISTTDNDIMVHGNAPVFNGLIKHNELIEKLREYSNKLGYFYVRSLRRKFNCGDDETIKIISNTLIKLGYFNGIVIQWVAKHPYKGRSYFYINKVT